MLLIYSRNKLIYGITLFWGETRHFVVATQADMLNQVDSMNNMQQASASTSVCMPPSKSPIEYLKSYHP